MRIAKRTRRFDCLLLFSILYPLFAIFTPGCSSATESQQQSNEPVRMEIVASRLENPLYLTSPPSDPRLFIVEQPGRIRIVKNKELLKKPFLDITDRVRTGGERGLFSVAFHPHYAANGFFYVDYTDKNGDTHVERYSVTADPDVADPSSAKLLLFVKQPFANHNGGHIQFGPDGMLYIGMGDGGSAGDPYNNAQNPHTLLGALLRIDVDHGDPYTIPKDNPFVAQPKGRGEIWATGLRNPWRFAFDPETKLLYIADVGQNRWEEVDIAPANQAGLNYGWNILEGNHCYRTIVCRSKGFVPAAYEYDHSKGCSITGGYVYRGKKIPFLQGHYFYGDYCLGWIESFRYENGEIKDRHRWELGVLSNLLSFGEDSSRELYALFSDGNVYRFVAK